MNAGDLEGPYAANIEITLRNGQVLVSGERSGGIDFGQAWDESRVEAKFRWLCGYVLPDETIDRLAEMVWNLEDVDLVLNLTALL